MQTFDNENYKKAMLNIKAAADSMKLNPSVRHYVKCLREGSNYREDILMQNANTERLIWM